MAAKVLEEISEETDLGVILVKVSLNTAVVSSIRNLEYQERLEALKLLSLKYWHDSPL